MSTLPREFFDELTQFDSATVFNAVVESICNQQGGVEQDDMVGGVPENYTGPELKCLLPEYGVAVGYAVTAEVTTNDPDSVPISWDKYHDMLAETGSPMVTVMKDIDTRPGRGASFGDGMANMHKFFGVTGAIIDGSVRDIAGIREVGLPVWGTGLVPGHGVFRVIDIGSSVTVASLRIHSGEILIADEDGCTKIPSGHDPITVLETAKEIRRRENQSKSIFSTPGFTVEDWKRQRTKS